MGGESRPMGSSFMGQRKVWVRELELVIAKAVGPWLCRGARGGVRGWSPARGMASLGWHGN